MGLNGPVSALLWACLPTTQPQSLAAYGKLPEQDLIALVSNCDTCSVYQVRSLHHPGMANGVEDLLAVLDPAALPVTEQVQHQ